jgi:hypothetical protein
MELLDLSYTQLPLRHIWIPLKSTTNTLVTLRLDHCHFNNQTTDNELSAIKGFFETVVALKMVTFVKTFLRSPVLVSVIKKIFLKFLIGVIQISISQ